jgi:hypothetical protein
VIGVRCVELIAMCEGPVLTVRGECVFGTGVEGLCDNRD